MWPLYAVTCLQCCPLAIFAQCCFSPTVVLCLPFWKESVFGMLAFEGSGKLEHPNKYLSEQEGKNQQQIQPTYMYGTTSRTCTWAILVGRELSHTPPHYLSSLFIIIAGDKRSLQPILGQWHSYCIVKFFLNLSTFLGCSCCTTNMHGLWLSRPWY